MPIRYRLKLIYLENLIIYNNNNFIMYRNNNKNKKNYENCKTFISNFL